MTRRRFLQSKRAVRIVLQGGSTSPQERLIQELNSKVVTLIALESVDMCIAKATFKLEDKLDLYIGQLVQRLGVVTPSSTSRHPNQMHNHYHQCHSSFEHCSHLPTSQAQLSTGEHIGHASFVRS